MTNPSMLSFSPALSGLEILHSHRSTLESFGKKVDEKTKTLRSAEILFAAKKADWDAIGELSQELKANSEMVIVLTEGLCETVFKAVRAFCSPLHPEQSGSKIKILSSSMHAESLEAVAKWIVGRKVSLVLAFHNTPSERLFWTFRVLLKALSEGRDMLFDIDWQGAEQIKHSALRDHVLSIFVLPPSIAELRRRLVSRAKDTEDTISKRMQKSWDEISHWHGYDYVLVNDDLDTTFDKLKTIVEAERLRQAQQPDLFPFIRSLQAEFDEEST
mgnify:CR=1 FL=1